MTHTTRTELRFTNTTIAAVQAAMAEGEWPVDFSVEGDWTGADVVVASLVTYGDDEGDASADEFEDCAARSGLRFTRSYVAM